MMGVINLTPNSFSDGGLHHNLVQLESLLLNYPPNSVIDIGLESTAPMNSVISLDEEKKRFDESFLPILELCTKKFSFKNFSFDTYRTLMMEYILSKLPKELSLEIIWNDISGCLDDELITLLKKYPAISYVHSHNLAGKVSRLVGSQHMQYLDESLSLKDVISYFNEALSFFKNHQIDLGRVYFDPCFGFSKSAQQNYELLDNFSKLLEIHEKWIFGISRKSFLQKLVVKEGISELSKEEVIEKSEVFHEAYIKKTMKMALGRNVEVLFRVHNPRVFTKI